MLVYLAEVFENDGDVHVDDDEEADDEISDQIGNGHAARTAVAVRSRLAWRIIASYHTNKHQRQWLEKQLITFNLLQGHKTKQYKKGQLSLTNPRDAGEKFARFT